MEYIKPNKIQKGMTIGIISLSGAIREKETLDRGIEKLHSLGYKTKISKHIFDKKNYLAGDDNTRLEELHKFFKDPEIDCILCSRGGYGAIKILDKIDYSLIQSNPKPFCGYSDITAYSIMFLKHANLITYSAPMVCGDFGAEIISEFTISNFIRAIEQESLTFDLDGCVKNYTEGIAFGGNLTTIASLCGRDFIPNEDFIFIIEDVNEPVYKIDRCLEQLYGMPEFRTYAKGIVLGDFSGADTKELKEFINEYSQKMNIPVWQGLKLGHGQDKITFPIGSECIVKNNKIFFKQNT